MQSFGFGELVAFAGKPANPDPVWLSFQLKAHDTTQARFVNLTIAVKWRDQNGENAA
jgi:hypothetical protein